MKNPDDGPPYCMNCCGTGYVRIPIAHYPWTDLIDCKLCEGTGLAKDHPKNIKKIKGIGDDYKNT